MARMFANRRGTDVGSCERGTRLVHARRARPKRGETQLVASEILGLGLTGRAAKKSRERANLTDVVTLGVGAKLPDRHVFDHAAAQRADSFGDHRGPPSETAEPRDLHTGPERPFPRSLNLAGSAARAV